MTVTNKYNTDTFEQAAILWYHDLSKTFNGENENLFDFMMVKQDGRILTRKEMEALLRK